MHKREPDPHAAPGGAKHRRSRRAFAGRTPSVPQGTLARSHGFTLVELILVILLVGILSFVAAPRLNDRGQLDARGFADQVAATLRFAQKAAIAQRRNVYVNVDSAMRRVYACLDAAPACASPLASPAGGALDIRGAATVTLTASATQFSFDALGRPSATSNVTLATSASGLSFNVTVETESGYVRRS